MSAFFFTHVHTKEAEGRSTHVDTKTESRKRPTECPLAPAAWAWLQRISLSRLLACAAVLRLRALRRRCPFLIKSDLGAIGTRTICSMLACNLLVDRHPYPCLVDLPWLPTQLSERAGRSDGSSQARGRTGQQSLECGAGTYGILVHARKGVLVAGIQALGDRRLLERGGRRGATEAAGNTRLALRAPSRRLIQRLGGGLGLSVAIRVEAGHGRRGR